MSEKFDYTGALPDGKQVKGSVEAASREAAIRAITDKGYQVVSLKKSGGFDPNDIKLPGIGSSKVKLKDNVAFTRQLSTMINAGVPLIRSLNTLKGQTESEALKSALVDISKDIESGQSLGDALEKHPKAFGTIYVNMVRAGEAGGILDEILNKLATQQEKDASIRKKVKSASTYPIVLIGITFTAFFALMIFVVPQIGTILKDLGGEDAELPPITQALLTASEFSIKYWYILIGGSVGSVVGIKKYISTPSGKKNFHRLLLKTPVVKDIITKVALARFSRTFASLMASGVSVLEAIKITGKSMGNVIIEEELMNASAEVKAGRPLSEPISASPIFPPILSQMLAIGEETGDTSTVLTKIADFYEEEVDTVIDSLSSIIEPIMIVILGGMVGLIAASVIGPISSLANNVG